MAKTNKITMSIEDLIENYVNEVFNPAETLEAIEEVVKKEVETRLKDFKPTTETKKIEILQGKKIIATLENQPKEFESILQYASNNINLLLVGGAGTGKGTIAENIAKVLKADFFEVPACQLEHQWEGFVDANGNYKATEFYLACKNASEGKKTVLLLDELDCCDPCTLKHFNDCFERKWYRFPNNEKLDFKENLILIAAANTYGTGANMQYIGNQLDSSTLDRFTVKEISYDDNIQMLLTGNNENLVKFFNALRLAADNSSLKFIASYRSLKTIAKMEGITNVKYFHMEFLPDLRIENDLLAYPIIRFNIPEDSIIKVPSEHFIACMRNSIYTWYSPEAKKQFPNISRMQLFKAISKQHKGTIVAGVKKSDGMMMSRMINGNKGICLYPMKDWTLQDVFAFMKIRNIAIPTLTKKGCRGVGINDSEALFIYENYPDDWEKIERVFPFVRAIIYKYKYFDIKKTMRVV